MTWFKGGNSYDKYKNEWKAKLNSKWRRRKNAQTSSVDFEKEIICPMFVPPSSDATLFKKIEAAEAKLEENME